MVFRENVYVCVLCPDCVGMEAVAPTYAAIILSLFHSPFVGRSVDAIITSNRMDHGHKRANGRAALGGKCVITSQSMAIDRRCVCACDCESPWNASCVCVSHFVIFSMCMCVFMCVCSGPFVSETCVFVCTDASVLL